MTEKQRKQQKSKRQNAWNAEHYRKITIQLDLDLFEKVQQAKGSETLSGYIKGLISDDLKTKGIL